MTELAGLRPKAHRAMAASEHFGTIVLRPE